MTTSKKGLKKHPDQNWTTVFALICAISFTSFGVWMIIEKKGAYGIHSYTQQYTATGGELIVLVGIIFFIAAYFTLSPFSKFREFFERRRRK